LIKKLLLACAILALGSIATCNTPSIPEQIMESVVLVNRSSGVVVYSDKNISLVLTAYHVIASDIEKAACSDCQYRTEISFLYFKPGDKIVPLFDTYKAIKIDTDELSDLAMIEIHPGKILSVSNVAKNVPSLGDDIWLGSNPNLNYRSLKKGVVSSTDRIVGGKRIWEISGGIIFGSSGGGAFDTHGQIFGVIRAVDPWESRDCYGVWDDNGELLGYNCVVIPLTYIGFITPPALIHKFIKNGLYKEHFKYLK
jgi:S1-C subfamily serine protease